MPWTLCFPVAKDPLITGGSRSFCIEIPILVTVLPPHVPDPGPLFTLTDFKNEDVRALQLLATLDHVAEGLPGEASRDLKHSISTHMQTVGARLGAGIHLSRNSGEGRTYGHQQAEAVA